MVRTRKAVTIRQVNEDLAKKIAKIFATQFIL